MGIFDSLKRQAQQQLQQQVKNAVQSVASSASATLRHSRLTLSALPRTLSELQAMPEGNCCDLCQRVFCLCFPLAVL